MSSPDIDTHGKVVLVNSPAFSHRTAEENLGLGYLAASLRRHQYSVDIIDAWLEKLTPLEVAQRIIASEPPLYVGVSAYRSNLEQARRLVEELKKMEFSRPLVAGGMGPTFYPEDFLRVGFDLVIRGEAEEAVCQLARHYQVGDPSLNKISGAGYFKNKEIVLEEINPSKQEIDQIIFPSRDTMPYVLKRHSLVQVLTARGCNAHCSFCSVIAFQKLNKISGWRERSILNIVTELEDISQQGASFIKIIDDSFIEPPRDEQWCHDFADEIERRGLNLTLRGSVRADRVSDDILRELKRAGFVSFSCGLENFSPRALKRMSKTATLEDNMRALELFRKYDLVMQQGMIIFDPGTTMVDLEENYSALRQYDFTVIKGVFTEMYAAEGTVLTKQLTKDDRLKESDRGGNRNYDISDPKAAKVYLAIKEWHRNHAWLYDMAIDPISAPKALTRVEMDMFLPLIKDIRHHDLDFMRKIMDLVNEGYSQLQLEEVTKVEIKNSQPWFESFKQRLMVIYDKVNLIYDAENNPFI